MAETYETFDLHQVIPAPGWSLVYWNSDTTAHVLAPCYMLALVTRHTRLCATGRCQNPAHVRTSCEDHRHYEIVGLEWVDGAFAVADNTSNFCGLLPPGQSLLNFQERQLCVNRHGTVKDDGLHQGKRAHHDR